MQDPTDPVRALVTAASRHGATKEIADRIGEVLSRRGLDVVVQDPEYVLDVSDVDVVVLGSAVYAGHWDPDAREIADLIAMEDPKPLTWLFSSGPVGPLEPDRDVVNVADILQATAAREHRVFFGKIDKTNLSFGEKAIVSAVRAPEGDYRDWDEIEAWANDIADHLIRVPQEGMQ